MRDIEADIGGMTVKVKPASDRTLDLAALRSTLAREGVRMRRALILADGDVERSAEASRFRIRGWPYSFALRGDAPDPGPARVRATLRMEGGEPTLRIED